MSILLIDPDPELGRAIIERLVAEGDEVRVIAGDPSEWRQLGAFVAVGDPMDPDLVERACMNVRTLVFTSTSRSVPISLLAATVPSARRTGVDRLVVCAPSERAEVTGWLDDTAMSYVLLVTGKRGFLPKKAVDPTAIAGAVSAADDLAGAPRLVVDLTERDEWSKLGGHA